MMSISCQNLVNRQAARLNHQRSYWHYWVAALAYLQILLWHYLPELCSSNVEPPTVCISTKQLPPLSTGWFYQFPNHLATSNQNQQLARSQRYMRRHAGQGMIQQIMSLTLSPGFCCGVSSSNPAAAKAVSTSDSTASLACCTLMPLPNMTTHFSSLWKMPSVTCTQGHTPLATAFMPHVCERASYSYSYKDITILKCSEWYSHSDCGRLYVSKAGLGPYMLLKSDMLEPFCS